ncbi:MAG: ClpXP protease specificity-enhancing factor SspB [Pseudomonadota bacterium]
MTRSIDYGRLMHRAMRGLIQEVLIDVRDNGLPGAHHFFITFETNHPDVRLADWLRDRYPSEMTVVMQHWFDDLEVLENGFGVTLNFGDSPENLFVPYNAIQTFVDPSVEFGLRFESHEEEDEEQTDAETPQSDPVPQNDPPGGEVEAEIVSLDNFRK